MELTVKRFKIYAQPGRCAKFAWKWGYVVTAPLTPEGMFSHKTDGTFESHMTGLDNVSFIKDKFSRLLGEKVTIVKTWEKQN